MSFRTDKVRGRHPITPKKGIKETDLSIKEIGSNDTFAVSVKPQTKTLERIYNVRNVLKEVFETNRIEYYKKSFQTNNYIFFMNVKKLTPEIVKNWSRRFPNGSYYSIAKASDKDNLRITVDVTEQDFIANGMG